MVQSKNSVEAWLRGNAAIIHEHVLLNCKLLRFTYLAESNGIFPWTLLAGPLAKF
jgi:hypothetical protein